MDEIQKFLLQGGYTRRTKQRYKYCLALLRDHLETNQLNFRDLSIDDYMAYIEGQEWNQNTARLHCSAARSFLRWKFGNAHPVLQLNLPREDSRPGRVLNKERLNQILATFDTSTGKGWRDLAIFSVMVETGVRANEICTLVLDHLDLERCRMLVLAKGQRWEQKIFSHDTARTLDMWLVWRKKYALPEVQEVFVSVGGNTPGAALTRYGLASIFRYLSKKVGFKLSPHDMRRTFATLMIEAGAPTRVVQELGGWSNIREVERYTKSLTVTDIEAYSPIMRRINVSQLNPGSYPDDDE